MCYLLIATIFLNLLLSHNLYPTIFFPTRQTQNSATLIDNVFTNTTAVWNIGVLNCNLSDHYMIFICTNMGKVETNNF